jgi:hypothetical protein
MKHLTKILLSLTLLSFAFHTADAQTTAKKKSTATSKSKTTTAPKKTAPVAIGKEVTVTLKNLSEGTIAIFAGPKDELKNTLKKKTVGGLSKNTLYLHVNEVVCILNSDKIVSCVAIQGTTTLLEINSSGNVITAK